MMNEREATMEDVEIKLLFSWHNKKKPKLIIPSLVEKGQYIQQRAKGATPQNIKIKKMPMMDRTFATPQHAYD